MRQAACQASPSCCAPHCIRGHYDTALQSASTFTASSQHGGTALRTILCMCSPTTSAFLPQPLTVYTNRCCACHVCRCLLHRPCQSQLWLEWRRRLGPGELRLRLYFWGRPSTVNLPGCRSVQRWPSPGDQQRRRQVCCRLCVCSEPSNGHRPGRSRRAGHQHCHRRRCCQCTVGLHCDPDRCGWCGSSN